LILLPSGKLVYKRITAEFTVWKRELIHLLKEVSVLVINRNIVVCKFAFTCLLDLQTVELVTLKSLRILLVSNTPAAEIPIPETFVSKFHLTFLTDRSPEIRA
jgi:hypothetical protein